MKFGKEYTSQMVPEWQEAYMDYNFLKSHLKEIQRFRQRTKPPTATPRGLRRKLTLYRAFSGLTQQKHYQQLSPSEHDIESQPIMVHSVNNHDGYEKYQTTRKTLMTKLISSMKWNKTFCVPSGPYRIKLPINLKIPCFLRIIKHQSFVAVFPKKPISPIKPHDPVIHLHWSNTILLHPRPFVPIILHHPHIKAYHSNFLVWIWIKIHTTTASKLSILKANHLDFIVWMKFIQ